jgi:hypothetical protein
MKTQLSLLTTGILTAAIGTGFGQPIITTQPQSQTNVAGTDATFSVAATGTPSLNYQWQFHSSTLANQTNTTLVLTNVQTANAGSYTVVVTNREGAVTSLVATLAVMVPPTVTKQPTKQSASLGASVTFSVLAAGTAPLSYQWRFNEVDLPGKTNTSLVLKNLQLSNAGDYAVVVTNVAGSVTSQIAHLEVDPTFTKVTSGKIVNDSGVSFACAWGDYDDDGYIDLFVTNWGEDFNPGRNFLYHNNRDGNFTPITSGPPVTDFDLHTGVSWADYDNDGHLDLLVTKWNSHDSLYRGNGNGGFTLTNTIVGRRKQVSTAGVWGDFDKDGWLDLFVAAVGNQPGEQAADDILYQSDRQGGFKPISFGTKPLGKEFSITAAWGDFDNDGYPDLAVSQGGWAGPEHRLLYHNNRDGTFSSLTNSTLFAELLSHEGCAWGDFNNDGWLDLFIGAFYGQNNSLFFNNGDGTFTQITNSPATLDGGTTKNVTLADYDNDGWLDVFVSNTGPREPGSDKSLGEETNFLYHNKGNGAFSKITSGSPVNELGHSSGSAWGDYDNDGFLDLFVCNGYVYTNRNNLLYRNNGNNNAWLNFRLVGTASNRSAIGAKVRLKATVHGRTFWQMREISGGSGFLCQNDMRANFGLGDATNADLVRIEWPSGTVQEFQNVAVKQFLTVTEPPGLSSAAISNGIVQLVLKGGRGFQYDLQASSNLVNWATVATLSVTNISGTASFADPAATNFTRRFYRAVGQ